MSKEPDKVAYSAILRSLSAEKFAEVFAASTRQARETYFHRHGVKAPSTGRLPKPGAKNEARILKLHELLQHEEDDEMAEEILRSWLLTKRAMLAAALDHLGIPHQNGLTDSDDLKKFDKLSSGDMRALAKAVEAAAPREELRIYLKFMGAQDVDKALG